MVGILDNETSPGWAFSIGLFKTFGHPEVVVFGLSGDLMHSIVNYVGEDVRSGKVFEAEGQYDELIEGFPCTFKTVNQVWYRSFLGYANWFYGNMDYPILQCIWPDKNNRLPWESEFDARWVAAQPLLFNPDSDSARTAPFLAR